MLPLFLLCMTGCAWENGKQSANAISDVPPTSVSPEYKEEEPDGLEKITPKTAVSNLEIGDGEVVCGSFDNSRQCLEVSCRTEDGEKVLYLNGEKQFSVSADSKVMLYDIATEDAYLELFVAEETTLNEEKCLRVNAYRVLAEGIQEISFLPVREDNSFFIEEWYWLSIREGMLQACFEDAEENGEYQLTPEGCFVKYKEPQTILNIDGLAICFPKNNVAVYKETYFGIAFETDYSMMGVTHYKVYRSLDGGVSWKLAADDFSCETAPIEAIYILDDATVYVSVGVGGASGNRSMYVSEDAGETWRAVET